MFHFSRFSHERRKTIKVILYSVVCIAVCVIFLSIISRGKTVRKVERKYVMKPEPWYTKFREKVHSLIPSLEDISTEGWDITNFGSRQQTVEKKLLLRRIDISQYPFRRKLILNAGGNKFETSTSTFMKLLQEKNLEKDFEVHVWEPNLKEYPEYKEAEKKHSSLYLHTEVVYREDTQVLWDTEPSIGAHAIESSNKRKKGWELRDTVDIVDWMMKNTEKDTLLIVKLDVEGVEWEIVEKMIRTGFIHRIDEFMLECHYDKWSKMRKDKTYEDCRELIFKLRDMGVYTHEWA